MKTRLLPPLMLAALTVTSAHALPDPQAKTAKLNGLLDGIGQVIGDSDSEDLFYVKPSDLKVTGSFYRTSMGMDCKNLHEFRTQFTKMPDPQDTDKILKAGVYVSPQFEMNFAFDYRNITTMTKINNLRLESAQIREDSKSLIAEYESSYQEKESISKDIEEARKESEVSYDRFMKELTSAQNDTERNEIRAAYKEEIAAYKNKMTELTQKRREAQVRFNAALKNWGPYKDELDYIKKLENDLKDTLAYMKASTIKVNEEGLELLNELNKKVIGNATVGYSLSTNEKVAELSKRVKDAGLNVSVRALDVFNVKMNPSLVMMDTSIKDSFNGDYRVANYILDSKTQIPLGTTTRRMTLPATIEQDGQPGKPIEFDVLEFKQSSGASQDFLMPVTTGAFCGEPEMKESKYVVLDNEGNKFERTITYPVFSQPGNRVLFAKEVPLTYNFYQKAERIRGSCELDISQSAVYVRKNGKKKSGGFFSRKTKKWDETRQDYKKDMGMFCAFEKRPAGSPEESDQINNAVEKALYQDMFSMFLTSYAKDFEIIPTPATELDGDVKIFDKIGTGMMNLCGKNKYCEFGSVVLKTMDELVGSRHSGTTSNTQTLSGKIKKTLDLDSYMVSEGSVSVKMQVCIDQKECQ